MYNIEMFHESTRDQRPIILQGWENETASMWRHLHQHHVLWVFAFHRPDNSSLRSLGFQKTDPLIAGGFIVENAVWMDDEQGYPYWKPPSTGTLAPPFRCRPCVKPLGATRRQLCRAIFAAIWIHPFTVSERRGTTTISWEGSGEFPVESSMYPSNTRILLASTLHIARWMDSGPQMAMLR